MSTTIEQLELEVQSKSSSAIESLDRLTSTLNKLKSATKGGLGLTTVSKQLTNLNTSVRSIDSNSADKLNKLAQGLQSLSICNAIKLPSSLSNQLINIGIAIQTLDTVNFNNLTSLTNTLTPLSSIGKSNLNSFISQLERLPSAMQGLNGTDMASASTQIEKLASALTPLSNLGKNNLTSFITQLSKIPSLMQSLQSIDMSVLTTQIQNLTNAFAPLATQMQAISNGFASFPTRIQQLITSTNGLTTSNNLATKSYINLYAKMRMAIGMVRGFGYAIASCINTSNQYIEDLNLFNVSLGEYAQSAKEYALEVSEIMGIDPSEWLRNQSVFMTITEGFGVASDRAYTMSQNLTQLAYDISSFTNISTENAFQKLQSGIAGELEPLRRIGYDLSVARLQQEAYTLGINKSVSAMTQAEKAELRYYAIMTQVTDAQGDMARTLEAPANQLRILQAQLNQCARALGNLFLPALQAVLPCLIALAKVIRLVLELIGKLFGFTVSDFSDSLGSSVGSVGDIADGLGDAVDNAKALKNTMLGIDELNVISPEDSSSSGAGSTDVSGGSGLGFDLPTYDFIEEAVSNQISDIVEGMKEWLGINREIDSWADLFYNTRLGKILETVIEIGVGFAAWKIATSVTDFVKMLTSLGGISTGLSIGSLFSLMDDLNHFVDYLVDFLDNGATFNNVSGMISEFSGAIGEALMIKGDYKTAGVFLAIQAVTGLANTLVDMYNNGANFDNVTNLIREIGVALMAIGALTGNNELVGIGLIIKGVTNLVKEIYEHWDEIKELDFKNIDITTIVTGVGMIIGGFITFFGLFSKLKGTTSTASQTIDTVRNATNATGSLDNAVSTGLSPKLKSLATNLLLGVVIIAEVAAAALLIAGAIVLLGVELSYMGEAWQPVIDNKETVITAMTVGAGILLAIGVVTALLGKNGKSLITDLGVGILVLAEVGAAALLFIAEIWAVGKGLDEIGQAWQPVLDNGETIALGIGIGTGLLVAIGVATAALGVVTVASAGSLPIAIGIGTALLVELAVAFIAFTKSLVEVADELSENLAPSLENLNAELPSLSDNMSDFVDFMTDFAGEVVRYTKVSAIAGLSATIDTIIGWFTQDPIEKLSKDVNDIYKQTKDLNSKLNLAVPELEKAVKLLKSYKSFLEEMEKLCDCNVNLSNGMFVNMKEVGQNLVTGFVAGIESKSSDFCNAAKTLVDGFNNSLSTSALSSQTVVIVWASNIKNWFISSSYGAINSATFNKYAKDIVTGFNNGIKTYYPSSKSYIIVWTVNIKNWFTSSSYGAINSTTFKGYAKNIIDGFNNGISSYYTTSKPYMTTYANLVKNTFKNIASYDAFYDIAKDVIDGFNNGINDFYETTLPYMKKWAKAAAEAYKKELDSHSPSRKFMAIGEDTVLGYNIGIQNMSNTTGEVVKNWANSFTSVSPTMKFAVDTSALKYYNSDSFARSVSADVSTRTTVTATGFVDGMEHFYREYVQPTLSQMAEDMKRQADKKEQTIVQIGNRTVSDAVTRQKKANGYAFVHG